MTTPNVDELIRTAARFGLHLNAADLVTDGLPNGWAILPRHWGLGLYDCTILPSCGLGWSTGPEMNPKRKAIEWARREVASHLAECNRCSRTIEGTAVAS